MPVARASYRQSSASRPSAAAASPSMSDLRWLTGAHVYNRLKRLQRRPIRPPHRDSSPRADHRTRLVSAAAPLAPVGSRHRVSAAPPTVAATIAPASAPVALVATALAVPTSTAEATVVTTRHRVGFARSVAQPLVRASGHGTPEIARLPGAPFDPKHAPRISRMASASTENLVTGIPGTRRRKVGA